MKKQPAAPIPAVPGIDLLYRPQSYFWPLRLDTHLLSRVKVLSARQRCDD
jgi:hypothetical protein